MFKIKMLNRISEAGLSRFPAAEFLCGDEISSPDAVMVRSAPMGETEFPASLMAVARAGVGVNNIPVERCSEAGVAVFNTPGANANAVRELVIGALILTARRLPDAVEWAKSLKGNGAEIPKLVEKGKSKFSGPEIAGKKLGVIGLGAIGAGVANAAKDLGMEVYGYDPYLSVDAAWGLSRSVRHAENLSEIYQNCDFITIHVPLTPETRGFVDAEAIAAMKRGVRLFNFARGELVETRDVVAALACGKVASYTCDFPCEELLGAPHTVCIPHLGASTPESEDNCARMAAEELVDFLKTGSIRNSVNFPGVEMPVSSDTRITVFHRNVPNMLSQISSAIARKNINIENMVNKSRKEYAYTVLDVGGGEAAGAAEELRAIGGIIRVRVIR